MGSKKQPNSNPRGKARSVKPLHTALKKRLAKRKTRKDAPTLTDIGAELRGFVKQLKRAETYVIVAYKALDGQNAEQDNEVATLLRRDVGDLLFRQVRALENIAAQCDDGPRSDREDDDTEGSR